MRAEIFFKNGKKATVDNVINIDKRNGDVVLEFEREKRIWRRVYNL